jgi:Zn-dependent M28 family amino/carboxypeptidase
VRPAASAPPAPRQSAETAPAKRLALQEDVREAELRRALPAIAKPRVPGSAQWRRVQGLCADRFEAAGLVVERQAYGTGVNVLGKKAGGARSSERVVVSAHYDHVAGCEGADDNASGVAALFEVVRVLAKARHERTLIAACWDEEERGLLGSRAFSERARAEKQDIVAAFSLDAVGFASTAPGSQRVPVGFDTLFPEQKRLLAARQYAADFIAVIGSAPSRQIIDSLRRHATTVQLPLFAVELSNLQGLLLRDAYRSDHASFWANGYPAVLLTDTANFRNPGYHCENGPDSPKSIDYDFLARVARATALATLELLVPIEG